MRYRIAATLGPASSRKNTILGLLASGATELRLNTSHMELEEIEAWLGRLDRILKPFEPKPPLILDLQGGKWRLGTFRALKLEEGERVLFVHADRSDEERVFPVPHRDFFTSAQAGVEVILDDSRTVALIESVQPGRIGAVIKAGGSLCPRKGLTFSGRMGRCEELSQKDRRVLNIARGYESIRYALSYLQDAEELERFLPFFKDSDYLIAKLERGRAVAGAGRIASSVDELWLCRGDLGAEMGLEAMAAAVHDFSRMVRQLPVPTLMAGQVLEHMTRHPQPTRSEICYLHDLLNRGYGGIVLSDETAVGRYPLECCRAAALFR